LVFKHRLILGLVVVASRTRVLLRKGEIFTSVSAPVGACVGVLALSLKSFFHGGVGAWAGVRVFSDIKVSWSSNQFVLLSSLPETVFLSRLRRREIILSRT